MNLDRYVYLTNNDFHDEVYGLLDDEWHEFGRNTNYKAFLVKRK